MGNNNFIIKKNKKGVGVYASRSYKKGEMICFLRGKKKSLDSLCFHGSLRITDPLQIEKGLYIDLHKPYILLNHSCKPNAGIKKTVTLFALRNIKKDEEITYDYSTTIDEGFECKCDSKNCRGAIVDFFALPIKLQRYYYDQGALPDFILRRYRKRNRKPLFINGK